LAIELAIGGLEATDLSLAEVEALTAAVEEDFEEVAGRADTSVQVVPAAKVVTEFSADVAGTDVAFFGASLDATLGVAPGTFTAVFQSASRRRLAAGTIVATGTLPLYPAEALAAAQSALMTLNEAAADATDDFFTTLADNIPPSAPAITVDGASPPTEQLVATVVIMYSADDADGLEVIEDELEAAVPDAEDVASSIGSLDEFSGSTITIEASQVVTSFNAPPALPPPVASLPVVSIAPPPLVGDSKEEASGGLSGGAIAAIIVCVVLSLCVLLFVARLCAKRRAARKNGGLSDFNTKTSQHV